MSPRRVDQAGHQDRDADAQRAGRRLQLQPHVRRRLDWSAARAAERHREGHGHLHLTTSWCSADGAALHPARSTSGGVGHEERRRSSNDTPAHRRTRTPPSRRGQSMVEFAMVLPFLLVIVLGVVEVGYALLDQHVVTKLAREGANLISRDATLQEAEAALRSMSGRPINFADGSKVIFSVLKQGATTGTSNYGQMILYARHQFGNLARVQHGPDGWRRRLRRPPVLRGGQFGQQHRAAGHEPAQQPDLRCPADSSTSSRCTLATSSSRRSTSSASTCRPRSIRSPTSRKGGSSRITDMTTQKSRVRSEKGFTLVYMAVWPDHDAAVCRPGHRLGPRVCRQGAAQQGRGRRRARRRAHAEQRRSAC